MSGRLSTAAWQRTRALILATRPPICCNCGKPIDLTLRGRTTWAPSVDHLVPRNHGGTDHPYNLAPSHYGCNSRRGDKPQPTTNSRNW